MNTEESILRKAAIRILQTIYKKLQTVDMKEGEREILIEVAGELRRAIVDSFMNESEEAGKVKP
jgi:predicted DNA-binding antitoxin AbrB/MazE fold protein